MRRIGIGAKNENIISDKTVEKKLDKLTKENEELKEKVSELEVENKTLKIEVETKCSELKEKEAELEALKIAPSDKEKNKK